MKNSYFIIVIITILFNVALIGQSRYLPSGQSGLRIGGGVSGNEDATAFSGGVSVSIGGYVDLGLGYGSISFDEKLGGADLTATTLSPYIGIEIVKQSEELPIDIRAAGGYYTAQYSNSYLSNLAIEMSGSGWEVGGSISSAFSVTESIKIMPVFGITYGEATMKLEDNLGNEIKSDDNTTYFDIDLVISVKTGKSHYLNVSPWIRFYEEKHTIGVDFSYVLGFQ